MNDYTPYQQRIRKCFTKAYKFLDTHKHAQTEEDWETIVKDLNKFDNTDDIFMKELLVAVTEELEREFIKCK